MPESWAYLLFVVILIYILGSENRGITLNKVVDLMFPLVKRNFTSVRIITFC